MTAYIYLHSVALLSLLILPGAVPQLCLYLLLLPLADLPHGMELIPLQLEVAPLLPFSVQLLSEADDVLHQLQVSKEHLFISNL